jgi:hypothetical protein
MTPKKLKLWKLPKREGSILKHRIQWIVHSPHKTQLEKKNPPTTHKKKKGTLLHFIARFSLVAWKFQFPKLVATIFGLNSPPSHVQLFHITFLWHGSTP